jgi:predicted dehydrogenase
MDKFKFAIMGAGKIANHFCNAVNLLEDCEVIAISSKSMNRASEFAEKNGIKSVYDSYETMLVEERPDCVYIAVTPNAHYELCMLCLDYKIPILCEKAMFLNSVEAEAVFDRAAKLKVFVMEAMWSRFLPTVNKAKQWLEEGLIGKPAFLEVSIGFLAPKDKGGRYFNAELGGGVAYDITVYAYELTTYLISQKIEEMQVSAIFGDTGVDVTNHISVRFTDMLASFQTSFVGAMEEKMVIYGDLGKIIIPSPHMSSEAFLYTTRNELSEHYKDQETKNGFVYEIKEVMDCIKNKKIQSSVVPHNVTIQCSRLFDRIRNCN